MAIKTVQAIINGQTYNLTLNSSTGKYEATLTAPATSSFNLDDNAYPVTVKATDMAGNESTVDNTDSSLGSKLLLKVKEKVAPVISITAPTSGQLMAQNKPTIVFEVTDNDSGVDLDTVVLKIDSSSVSGLTHTEITDGYRFTYTPTSILDDGEHTITVTASDNDGNAADAVSLTFRVLATAPNLSITNPTDGLWTNNATLAFSGTTDASTLTVKVGSGTAKNVSISDGTFSSTVTLTEGENVLTFVATSAAGVTTTIERTVNLDTKPPVFTNVTLTPNPVDAGATYIISVELSD